MTASYKPPIVSRSDPGAQGAGVLWVHPDTGVTKVRNDADTDWIQSQDTSVTAAQITDAGAAGVAVLQSTDVALIRKTAVVSLTDAQIKALPTTGITVVAAPGSGFATVPIAAYLKGSCAAGAYTNIDAACLVMLRFASIASLLSPLDEAASQVSALLAASVNAAVMGGAAAAGTLANVENRALLVQATNAAAGNFTGGNAANTLAVTVIYAVVAV